MLAAITDLDGRIVGVNRTWLDVERLCLADLEAPRKVLGALLGHGVRFGRATDRLLAGEGIEFDQDPEAEPETHHPGVNGIDCKSAAFNRPYISAHGQVSACCWVTGSEEEAAFFAGHRLAPERYNIRNRPLEEILLDEPFASLYAAAWKADSLATCRHKCGKMLRNKRNPL